MDFLRELWMEGMTGRDEEGSAAEWEEMTARLSPQEIAAQFIELDYEGFWSGQTTVLGLSDDDYERLYEMRGQEAD